MLIWLDLINTVTDGEVTSGETRLLTTSAVTSRGLSRYMSCKNVLSRMHVYLRVQQRTGFVLVSH